MSNPSPASSVEALYRYPVKGLSGELLEQVTVRPGETFPFDRAYAIENGKGRFDPLSPKHLPKINFLMLMRDERLATLESRFDTDSRVLTILRDGKQVARGQLSSPSGRQMIEQFLAAYMQASLRGAPRIVSADGQSFSDVAAKCVHIVNIASAVDLGRMTGKPVDPLRFRANIYLDGLPPWQELEWAGRTLRIGEVELKVFARTERCAATDVDPATGARDMSIPAALQRSKGHTDFGVYATIATAGTLRRGDVVAAGA